MARAAGRGGAAAGVGALGAGRRWGARGGDEGTSVAGAVLGGSSALQRSCITAVA